MRVFGHPLHPILVHFPIAFWTVAVGSYVWAAASTSESIAMVAKFANGAGLTMAMLAMLAGLLELRSIVSQPGDASSRLAHDGHGDSLGLFPWCNDHSTAQVGTIACAGAGFLLMAVGGWLGGRLVYSFGVGVKQSEKP